jgi:hypothetical protein
VRAVSAAIKWDVAYRIVDVLFSRYSSILPPTAAIELRSYISNMDAKGFIRKLYECINTLIVNGIEDQDIERLVNNLFVNNYLIFSGACYGNAQGN